MSAANMSTLKSHKRKSNDGRVCWSIEQEHMLIDLWEENYAALCGPCKKTPIYVKIAATLQSMGVDVCGYDIKRKLENLVRRYRNDGMKYEHFGKPANEWVHFHRIHNMLHEFDNIDVGGKDAVKKIDFIKEDLSSIESCSSRDGFSQFDDNFETPESPIKRQKIETATLPPYIEENIEVNVSNNKEQSFNEQLFTMAETKLNTMISIAKDIKDYHKQMLQKSDINAQLIKMAESRTRAIQTMVADNKEFHRQMLELVRTQVQNRTERKVRESYSNCL